MKTNRIIAAALVAAFAAVSLPAAVADDTQVKAKEENKAVVKPYKLDVCVVSGEKLGEMGKPVSFVYNGQEIKLCCKNCRKGFDKDPAKYLKKLEGK
jgi:YHS domain-containing protein